MTGVSGPQMHERLVAEISNATESVFTTMLGLEAKAGHASAESPGPGPIGGISAMVGMVGPWTGAGSVSCDEATACKLASAMLMSEYTEVNDDVLDAMGEIANMVIGNIKTNLEMTFGQMSLGIPTVTFGKHFATRSTLKETWTLVPFACGGREVLVQVLLTDSSRISHRVSHHRVLAETGA